MVTALIIEDETGLQFLYKRVLEQEQFTVEIAKDGKIAMEVLAERMPDLIVMDMRMPNANGLDVMVYLQNHEDVANTHVVVISASQEFQRYIKMLPSAEFMLKPVMTQQLYDIAATVRQKSME